MSQINFQPTTPPPAALAALDARRSVPPKQLGEPAPDDATLLRMLQSAVRVPDHGKRVPFRFVTFSGDARHAFGQRLAARSLALNPNASAAVIDKDRQRFSYAPLIVAVIANLGPDEKIPESERFSSASCVCFALLQAAQALGFSGIWLTGWLAYDPEVRGWLGLGEFECVVGFVHIGTPKLDVPERDRPDPRDLLSAWTPA
ncbi:MAG: nitroreductase family protein [Lysobacter sp.]